MVKEIKTTGMGMKGRRQAGKEKWVNSIGAKTGRQAGKEEKTKGTRGDATVGNEWETTGGKGGS